MPFISNIVTNKQIASVLNIKDAIDVMRRAFGSYGKSGAMQPRVRIDAGATKLSTMGAILPGINAVGAKIYTTIDGRFTFVVVLFSAVDGSLLAVMEGDAMTEFRTAAVTALAADALAPHDARTLAVFGTGVQAAAHVPALLSVRQIATVLVVGIDRPAEFAQQVARQYGVNALVASADQAAAQADVLLTATRATTPLFDGDAVKKGAFVAAIGSSKPDAREVDDKLVRRASHIVVEWLPQAKTEAGDLLLRAAGCFDWQNVVELGQVIGTHDAIRRSADDIVLYKAIGVGLEDVALAEFVYGRMTALAAV